MNYNQNNKLAQITYQTLIVGVDIAKFNHVARAQDYRGFEFGTSLPFENIKNGFERLVEWIQKLLNDHQMNQVLIGKGLTQTLYLPFMYVSKEKGLSVWNYVKASEVLPQELIEEIQRYVQGKTLYIPKSKDAYEKWGARSGAKSFDKIRL